MNWPESIHDPITPDEARHLPVFYWNVKERLTAAQIRQRDNAAAKAKAKTARDVERVRQRKARVAMKVSP